MMARVIDSGGPSQHPAAPAGASRARLLALAVILVARRPPRTTGHLVLDVGDARREARVTVGSRISTLALAGHGVPTGCAPARAYLTQHLRSQPARRPARHGRPRALGRDSGAPGLGVDRHLSRMIATWRIESDVLLASPPSHLHFRPRHAGRRRRSERVPVGGRARSGGSMTRAPGARPSRATSSSASSTSRPATTPRVPRRASPDRGLVGRSRAS